MADKFLHGIENVTVDDGTRPITTVRSSTIGLIGTAPLANETAFPLNTPVLITGSRLETAKLGTTGTLPDAIDSIFDQIGAVVVVVRVEQGLTDTETLANILGGVDAVTGQYEGVHAFLAAENMLGFVPKILLAPGFTQTRTSGGVLTAGVTAGGTGYTDGTYNLTVTGAGTGAVITATVLGGIVTSTAIVNPGSGYTVAPTLALPAGAGAGTGATFSVTVGTVGNAVVAEMIGIAERLKSVIIADGPNTNDADAIAYSGDFGSKRVFLVDPKALKINGTGTMDTAWSSAHVA